MIKDGTIHQEERKGCKTLTFLYCDQFPNSISAMWGERSARAGPYLTLDQLSGMDLF